MWQDPDVEHVRVRQDEVRPLPDLPAALRRRVAVVDGRPDARRTELRHRPHLILRERLGRIEVEGALLRLARERVEHGEVEGERLSAGSAGRDDHVLPAGSGLPCLRLMCIESVDAARFEGLAYAWMQAVWKRRHARLPSLFRSQ